MTLKLLVAEDAAPIADAVAFGARMIWPNCRVSIAASGDEALRLFGEEQPDLVVLDVSMPPPDGFEVCRRIRQTSAAPILMLTVRDATLDKVRAFDLGADDYLTKPFDHLELLARLRALVRRASQPDSNAQTFVAGDFVLDFAMHRVSIGGRPIRLTSTEYRLLEVLVRHAGTVLSHHFLLDQVWGPQYTMDTQYLKVFVRRVRQKLNDNVDSPRYIQTAWGTGYRFVLPPR